MHPERFWRNEVESGKFADHEEEWIIALRFLIKRVVSCLFKINFTR